MSVCGRRRKAGEEIYAGWMGEDCDNQGILTPVVRSIRLAGLVSRRWGPNLSDYLPRLPVTTATILEEISDKGTIDLADESLHFITPVCFLVKVC